MENKLSKIFYFVGILTGQFILLCQSIIKAEKNFSEFNKAFDKAMKVEWKRIGKKTEKITICEK